MWMTPNSQFFADFHKNTTEVPTKISKKKNFFVPSKFQKNKGNPFITVVSFFYGFLVGNTCETCEIIFVSCELRNFYGVRILQIQNYKSLT